MDIFLLISFAVLILLGIGSIFLLVFPAHIYLFIVVLIFGFATRFQHLKGWELGVLGGVAVLMIFIDYASGLIGAKIAGASKKAVWMGILGLIIGLILYPPFGGILGLFLGVFIAEIIDYKKLKHALKSASGTLIGTLSGVILNLILGLLFLILFVVFAWK